MASIYSDMGRFLQEALSIKESLNEAFDCDDVYQLVCITYYDGKPEKEFFGPYSKDEIEMAKEDHPADEYELIPLHQ